MTAPHSDRPTPYADAAQLYRAADWDAPIPVVGKYPPPEGWTGQDGRWPSGADIQEWIDYRGTDNVGLRLPPTVLGIDVDNYGDKRGAATLAACEAQWGALPQTWRSTSRDDGISGIRLFRIPAGGQWPGQLPGGGVELIQWSHRYVVCWPSIHPKTGGTYRWTKDGVTALNIPKPYELPRLPVPWIIGLVKGPARHEDKADIDSGASWVSGLPGAGDPTCPVMASAVAKAVTEMRLAGSRHDCMTEHQLDLVRLSEQGHPGGMHALQALGEAFVAVVGPERGNGVASAEYVRALDGACARVAAAPSWPPMTVDPCTVGTIAKASPGLEFLAPETDEGSVQVSSWVERSDLAAALDGRLPSTPPTELARADGTALLYAGRVNALLGPSESGKTWIALLAAAQAMEAGRNVVMLDFEDDVMGLVTRLRSLGVPDETILTHMHYLAPSEPLTAASHAALMDLLREISPSLIILDGVNAAMTTMGLDLVSNKDATLFHVMLLKPMSLTGAAVVVVDHTPKNDLEGMSKGGIGAQAKRAAITGASIKVEVIKNFSRSHSGLLKLTVDKDRGGHVRMATTMGGVIGMAHIEPGVDGALSVWIEVEPESVNDDGDFRPTVLMDRVADFLTEHPGATVRTIMQAHMGRDKFVRDAIDILVSEGYVSRANGPNRAIFHSMIKVWPGSVSPVWPGVAGDGMSGGVARGKNGVLPRRATSPLSGYTEGRDTYRDWNEPGGEDE